jgi:coenzyme Q-binding protein COQ10
MDDLQSAAVGVVFNEAVRRMVGAFRKRALEVYGPPVAAGAAPRGRQS